MLCQSFVSPTVKKSINYDSAHTTSKESAKTVRHYHEKTLCTGTDAWFTLGLNIERTGDIEEIKSHSINYTGCNYHP